MTTARVLRELTYESEGFRRSASCGAVAKEKSPEGTIVIRVGTSMCWWRDVLAIIDKEFGSEGRGGVSLFVRVQGDEGPELRIRKMDASYESPGVGEVRTRGNRAKDIVCFTSQLNPVNIPWVKDVADAAERMFVVEDEEDLLVQVVEEPDYIGLRFTHIAPFYEPIDDTLSVGDIVKDAAQQYPSVPHDCIYLAPNDNGEDEPTYSVAAMVPSFHPTVVTGNERARLLYQVLDGNVHVSTAHEQSPEGAPAELPNGISLAATIALLHETLPGKTLDGIGITYVPKTRSFVFTAR